MIEFALCSTLLILFFLGTFQFGFAFYQYNLLNSAVRGGVRYASLVKISNQGNGILSPAYIQNVQNVVVYGTPTPTGFSTPIIPGLTAANVDVSIGVDARFVPLTVTVKINTMTIDAIVKTFTITGKPVLQMPFLGQYCPVGC